MRRVSHKARPPLPEGCTRNGRLVWEPPILYYSRLIKKEDNDKRRKALLERYKGDAVKTTKWLDIHYGFTLTYLYQEWALGKIEEAINLGKHDTRRVFHELLKEINLEARVVILYSESLGFLMRQDAEGEWIIYNRQEDTTPIAPAEDGHKSSTTNKVTDETTQLERVDDDLAATA